MDEPQNRNLMVPNLDEMFATTARNKASLAGRYDAAEIFEHLMERLKDFQNELHANEEIAIQLANYGMAAEIHIREVSFKNPNIIEFTGLNGDKNRVTLIQHISQLNFLLVATTPLEENSYRIGF